MPSVDLVLTLPTGIADDWKINHTLQLKTE
jgi:hypothetical protein